MEDCTKCGARAVAFIRYAGIHLCKTHFGNFVMSRIKKQIRRQINIKNIKNIAVAVSGGKDSGVVLYALSNILGNIPSVSITAISVDEGIEGYRPSSLEAARELCRTLEVPHKIVSFENAVGITLDETATVSSPLTPCSYCGVWRKKCLNMAAREMGADVLVTGHNLDDMAQSVAMNIFKAEVDRLVRMGPHKRVIKDLVPRVMPLRTIPEKEIYLFAFLNNIPHELDICPYSTTAHRGVFRDVVNMVEKNTPGTRHRLLKSYQSIYDAVSGGLPPFELSGCSRCGEPSSNHVCKACQMEKDVKERLAVWRRDN